MVVTAGAYHWLVSNGLWTGTIFAFTGVLVTAALGKAWSLISGIHPFKLWREHVRTQKAIAQALDTSTPGGLTDVVAAINNTQTESRR